MYTVIFIYISVHLIAAPLVGLVTVTHSSETGIVAKSRIELKPYEVDCELTDIVILSAPIININETFYYLSKPNGDVLKLDIYEPRYQPNTHKNMSYLDQFNNIEILFVKNGKAVISPVFKYEVLNANRGYSQKSNDTLSEKLTELEPNDFVIGPLDYDSHGNWVLSVYYKDQNDWVEVFQVITINIIEIVPSLPQNNTVKQGETFQVKFAYPIKYLQSCELNAPKSSFDRFYDRLPIDMNSCGYVVKNVTAEDAGVWKIIGVGKIVYMSTMYLIVDS